MDVERFRPSALSKLLYLTFIIVAVVLGVELLQNALPRYIPYNWATAHELDAIVDWKAARLAFEGKSPYTPEGLEYIGASIFGWLQARILNGIVQRAMHRLRLQGFARYFGL